MTLGWSVYYFKGFTLLVYLLSFLLLHRMMKSQRNVYTKETFLLTAFLIFANPLMFIYGFTYRPEILVMMLGFSSFLALEKVRNHSESNYIWASLAGLAVGTAFLAHLNGIIFGVAGFFYLIIYRKYKEIIAYSISAVLIASLYFIDLIPAGNFQLFLSQMKNWPDAVSGNYISDNSFLLSILLKLGNEHQRFFWSDKVAVFSALFFFSVITSFSYLLKHHRPLMIYTGLLILLLNLLGSQIAERYLIYYLPLMAIIIAVSIRNLVNEKRVILLSVTAVLFILQLAVLSKHCYSIFQKNYNFTSIHAEIGEMLPPETQKILAPYHYIFNEMGKKSILTYHSLEYYEVINNKKLDSSEALIRCKDLGIDCILLDKNLRDDHEKYRWFETAVTGSDPDYHVFKEYKGYIILLRRNTSSN